MKLKNVVIFISGLPNKLHNSIVVFYKRVQVGSNLQVNGKLYIHGNGKIIIGNTVTIHSCKSVNPIAGGNHTHLRAEDNAEIIIGNYVGMSHANINSMRKIVIEDNVLIGSCAKIWDTDFHSLYYSDRMSCDRNAKSEPVTIKEGAFIGACSIILKGVTVGRHSVVGAGSVVTKSIPDNELWAGNPAKFIRKLND